MENGKWWLAGFLCGAICQRVFARLEGDFGFALAMFSFFVVAVSVFAALASLGPPLAVLTSVTAAVQSLTEVLNKAVPLP